MSDLAVRLSEKLGLDVDTANDYLSAMRPMELNDIIENIAAMIGDAKEAKLLAAEIKGVPPPEAEASTASGDSQKGEGYVVYRKADEADDAPRKGKGRANKASASAPVVGGASVAHSKEKKKKRTTTGALDALHSTLLPGRHPCPCNARRHALLYNCLACGKVICEQEGEGPCLFCGADPHVPLSTDGTDETAQSTAARFKERLLHFDRTSAKRTTVIDDQEDYFAHVGADAWLSEAEKASVMARQQAREDAKDRERKELRLNFDFERMSVSRDVAMTGGAPASSSAITEEGARDDDGPPCCTPARGGCAGGGGSSSSSSRARLSRVLSRSNAPVSGRNGVGSRLSSNEGLKNPTLSTRPLFKSSRAAEAPADGGGNKATTDARPAVAAVGEEEMAQGLQYSVCRVQHDNPWLDAMLREEAAHGGEGYLESLASQAQEDRGRSGAHHDSATPTGASIAHTPSACACGGDDSDDGGDARDCDDGRQYCLSMHQPWASLLVAGIKRVEGRSWPTEHRGRLWIASTAREPNDLEIAQVEQKYMQQYSQVNEGASGSGRYEAVMAMQQQVHTFPAFPTTYPTSALLGCVTVTDCLSHGEYVARSPDAEENESSYVFLCARPRSLALPMRISGQHKIWLLDQKIAASARASLRPASATWDAKPKGSSEGAGKRPPGLGASSDAAASNDLPSRLDLHGDFGGGGFGGGGTIALRADRRQRLSVIQDGLVVMRGALELSVQQQIVDVVREIGISPAGFYAPKTRGGAMHLQMMCLGKHWDSVTQRYEDTRTNVDGRPPAPMPQQLWELVRSVAETASEACASIPHVDPGICLVNHYTHNGRLGMHQDKSESAASLRRGSPVISISIGDACDFAFSTSRPQETDTADVMLSSSGKVRSVRLESGDVLVFGGPARLLFHGVTKLHAHHRPRGLKLIPGRLNLTFREL